MPESVHFLVCIALKGRWLRCCGGARACGTSCLQRQPPLPRPTACPGRTPLPALQKLYNAHVPGQVVLIYPLPENEGSSSKGDSEQPATAGAEAGAAAAAVPPRGLVLVDCASRAVTRLRVSAGMIIDHFVDRAPVMQALGG